MTRKFSDKEREFYKQKIIESGTKLISVLGFKKTSIQDITDAAGVAKGTFYNFFSSKEELLFEILSAHEEFRDKLLNEVVETESKAENAIQKVLHESLEIADENKIFKTFYDENLMDKIALKLSPEKIQEHFEDDFQNSKEFIEHYQTKSNLIKADPKLIVGLLRGFFMLPLHKQEIGEDIYEEVMDLFVYVLGRGLTKDEVK